MGYESRDLAAGFRKAMRAIETSSLHLAELGWAIPMFLTPAEVRQLLEGAAPHSIDERFIELYESNDQAYFNEMAERLVTRANLRPWRTLLRQAASAYRRRQFVITVPALMIVCEGVLMADQGRRTDLRNVVSTYVQQVERDLPDSLTLVIWRTVERFVDQLYMRSDFDGPRPGMLNRHWILHGRDSAAWTHADSLRMFQAVDTVSNIAELREGPNKRIQRTP
ncbi:hypothetical protein [Limnochorda pilosa]|uniref:Uncharacterized protein n=1 Tax=Limnochorda pilosa TaxID=1555112 RepID=A0A0K2SIB1_LIMPI|nr:hypothetical protein [Limnochorda pilosa]BAS26752.1 hypothetical protein LIP_0895 [Limnochorda pilosa]